MSMLGRCFPIPRIVSCFRTQCSPRSSLHSSSISSALSSTTHRISNIRSFESSLTSPSLAISQRSFHVAARKLPSCHHQTHHHHSTHLASSTHPTPIPLLARHFRKGRKGPRAKLKSHSGSKKRFRFTRNGLIMRWRAGKSHKNYNKSSARLRRLSKPVEVYHGHVKMIRRSLPYGMRHSR